MKPLILLTCFLLSVVVGQDKYTDENRPYKFGFNIEGHQHRKEEKDEKGIIKGEYGFITADGYYRVTVYETDENNDFKIISMKNYYVGFPPGDPTTTPAPVTKNSASRLLLPLARTIDISTTTTPKTQELSTKHPGKGGTCSGCFLPTTTQKPKELDLPSRGTTRNPYSSSPKENTNAVLIQSQKKESSTLKPYSIEAKSKKETFTSGLKPKLSQIEQDKQLQKNLRPLNKAVENDQNRLLTPNQDKRSQISKTSKPQNINKTSSIGDIALPLNNAIEDPKINKQPKISIDEMMALLYRFNYTVGFHGHHEDGYRNGDKTGDYFVNGRDGISRKVTYLANEFGYQPNITLVQLNQNDENYPKEKSEKDYGLKGYEFKWFYRR